MRVPSREITRAEELALLEAIGRADTTKRQVAWMALLFDTGLRRGELCALRVEDLTTVVDADGHQHMVIIAPTEKRERRSRTAEEAAARAKLAQSRQLMRQHISYRRPIPLSWGAIASWRHLASGRAVGWICPGGRKDGSMSPQTIYDVWQRGWKAAALATPVPPPSSTRKTAAMRLHRRGAPARQVQAFLGHSKLSSTEHYLDHNIVDLIAAVHLLNVEEPKHVPRGYQPVLFDAEMRAKKNARNF